MSQTLAEKILSNACGKELKAGETLEENREIILRILKGKEDGAKTDIVLINSAFALLAGGRVNSIKEGIELAKESLEKGKPYETLEKVIEVTNRQI